MLAQNELLIFSENWSVCLCFGKIFLDYVLKRVNRLIQSPQNSGIRLTAWKQGRVPKYKTLEMIAKYFSVTVESLLKEEEKKPAEETAGEEEVKVALFGGAEEVTDEMWEEVKRFAEFIKQKYKK